MTATKDLVNLGIGMQSLALTGENIKLAKKKKIKTHDIVKAATKTIIGVELIKVQSGLASGL